MSSTVAPLLRSPTARRGRSEPTSVMAKANGELSSAASRTVIAGRLAGMEVARAHASELSDTCGFRAIIELRGKPCQMRLATWSFGKVRCRHCLFGNRAIRGAYPVDGRARVAAHRRHQRPLSRRAPSEVAAIHSHLVQGAGFGIEGSGFGG